MTSLAFLFLQANHFFGQVHLRWELLYLYRINQTQQLMTHYPRHKWQVCFTVYHLQVVFYHSVM